MISNSPQVMIVTKTDTRDDATPLASEAPPDCWPPRPAPFPDLMTVVEAAQYLRLDETDHTPESAVRTLNYWRDKRELKATKFARRVWYRKEELDRFLAVKTEA
jgi:hypothetical protein